ncbi:60S ribosomal protein L3 [Emericellopsis cladophorae]|uniref:Large ribosomal subunit protein mL44 n=1 Tax=Emericellopsis cladophorae TaxID=2686198 RepID=A0A9P9Y0W3_9HYPO|nr:60S ribosomal protein L3 [Emericellopsis cladophorae]KAI6781436.1 60S ribosomal protein L3 [Emericellopsis cladophorae]
MKRLRPSRWNAGQLLQARAASAPLPPRRPYLHQCQLRCLETDASPAETMAIPANMTSSLDGGAGGPSSSRSRISPKLSALHARLSLPKTLPLPTLARALITPSANRDHGANNKSLAVLGVSIINYHVTEYLLCKWPRLPMGVMYQALRGYVGPESLGEMARRWGAETAHAPGPEVDPGLLQWEPTRIVPGENWGGYLTREELSGFDRRAGDLDVHNGPQKIEQWENHAFASFAQALVGAIYSHSGREAAKQFVESHILSRQLEMGTLFKFVNPLRELSLLCKREGFEAPIARLESETGRMSRTPVFLVGIYSGKEKLGEGAGSSLQMARKKAAMASLKAWYLYSPGNKVRVPSDIFKKGAAKWRAPYIDCGEVIT